MRVKHFLFIMLPLLFTGCAATVVSIYNSDIGNNQPTTYLLQALEEDSLSEENKKLNDELIAVINKSFQQKGLKPSALPDLYISYLISVHTSSETQRNNYNSNYSNYYNPSSNYSTNNYKEGVLIIDVKNSDSKLVWQGSKTIKVRSRHYVGEYLPEVCREILTYYNIKGK
jgi:hypothetical protein